MLATRTTHLLVFVVLFAGEMLLTRSTAKTIKNKRSAEDAAASSSSWTDSIKGISSGQMPSFGSVPAFSSNSFSSYIPSGQSAAEKSKRSAEDAAASSSSWTDSIKGISSGQMPSFGSVPAFSSNSFSSYIPGGQAAAEKSKRSAEDAAASSSSWTDSIKGISSGQMPSFGSVPAFSSSSFSSYIPSGQAAAEKSKRSAEDAAASSSSWTDSIKGISSGQMPSFGSVPAFSSNSFSSYIPGGQAAAEKSKRSAEDAAASSSSWTDSIKGISSGQMPSFGSVPAFSSSSFSSYIPSGQAAAEKSKRSAEDAAASSSSWTDSIKGISSGQMPSFGSVPAFSSSSFSSYIPNGQAAAEKSKRSAEEAAASSSSWTDSIKGISSGQMPSFGSVPAFSANSFSSYIPNGQAAAEKSKRSAEDAAASSSSWTDSIKGISSGQMPAFGSVPAFSANSFSSYIPNGQAAAEKSKRSAEDAAASSSSWTDSIKGISSGQMPSFGSVPAFGSNSFSSYIPNSQAASSSAQ